MLFIGRTMNKETQLSNKEKGREKIGQSTVLRILLVDSHGHQQNRFPCNSVRSTGFFSPTGSALASASSLAEKRSAPEAGMCWYRCCGCARFGAPLLFKAAVTVQYGYSGI